MHTLFLLMGSLTTFWMSVIACADPTGPGCEVVTAGDTRLQITNATGNGLTVSFDDFPFQALMRSGACEIFGVPSLTANISITQCTFVSDDNCQEFGASIARSIALTRGEITALVIDVNFF
jgi:hypothetical protein